MTEASGPLDRVLRQAGGEQTLDALVSLPGADLTTLLLEAMRRRSLGLRAPDVLRRYREDRFVAPAVNTSNSSGRAESRRSSAWRRSSRWLRIR